MHLLYTTIGFNILSVSFLRTIPGFQCAEAPEHLLGDPLKEIERLLLEEKLERKANFDPSSMPKGKYAVCSEPTFIVRSVSNERKYKLLTQGWKIHISARPESAQKIAKLVLAVIDDSLHIFEGADGKIKYDHTYFKIVSSLPVMRTMDNVIGNLKGVGRETQAGKFITIYPASKKHAVALVQNWADARDPFPGLNLRWVSGPGQKAITWEKRPKSWDDLK